MKKFGFTITEALVALSIIGVVAAVALPSFVNQGRNDAYAKQLASTVSTLETAFNTMMATEGVQTMSETQFVSNPDIIISCEDPEDTECKEKKVKYGNSISIFANHVKINSSSNSVADVYGNIVHGTITPSNNNIIFEDAAECIFQLKNGVNVGISFINKREIDDVTAKEKGISLTKFLGWITIDVNGIKAPNLWGRDTFLFYLGDDGNLYPVGGKVYAIMFNKQAWETAEDTDGCNDTIKSFGCTARLVENNYEVDY